jgi:hypothetical protein
MLNITTWIDHVDCTVLNDLSHQNVDLDQNKDCTT